MRMVEELSKAFGCEKIYKNIYLQGNDIKVINYT